jgi:hypothetical protein
MVELCPYSSIRLHDVVRNYLSTGKTSLFEVRLQSESYSGFIRLLLSDTQPVTDTAF